MDSEMDNVEWDFIAGQFVTSAAPDGALARAFPGDLDQPLSPVPWSMEAMGAAVAAAQEAQPDWQAMGEARRAEILQRYQAAVRQHRDAIAQCISDEVGKPLWEARGEADALAAKVDLCLGPGAAYTRTQHIDSLPGEVRYRPLGVLAVVGPFNFPAHLPNGQILPALLTGNTVVHKPSERTPGVARWLARCLHEAGLPRGVFNLVQGPGELSAALCSHAHVDGVLFTGSADVGRRLVAANLDRLDRLIALELGGKNASIALADCDLEATARAVAFSAYVTAGQRCTATSRLIVEAAIAEPLLARIAELAQGLRVGHPAGQDTFMGPVIEAGTLARLQAAHSRARDAGYEALVAGGPAPVAGHRGHYVRPSLWRAPSGCMPRSVPGYGDEELFAPDLAAYVVPDRDAALEVASDTRFGLAAAVFCRDREAFEWLANRLRVGVVHWNRASAGASGRLPFGGVAASGNHRPAGILAGLTCTYPMSVLLEPEDGPKDGNWPGFPNPA